ncbi:MAG: hypothetical protein ACK42Z_06430 [Candidatus Kapaibacteriota bacterium]
MLIIPSFRKYCEDDKYFIDRIFAKYPNIKKRFDDFLARGGVIYAEGNAAYFIEKLGYLENGAVDFKNSFSVINENNLCTIEFTNSDHPITFTKYAIGDKLYFSTLPRITVNNAEIIAKLQENQNPVVFEINGNNAKGGRIIINTGLPTIGGMNELSKASRQLQWTLNAIFSAFCSSIDVTRFIYNDLRAEIIAGKNAFSYDRVDTFEVRIKIRNLSNRLIDNIKIIEKVRNYFEIISVSGKNISFIKSNRDIIFDNLTLKPFEEKEITIYVATPEPTNPIHGDVSKYISWSNYLYVSFCEIIAKTTRWTEYFNKYRNYAEMLFSAPLVADTDLNWKNILYLDFQPFKVFTIIENKERTAAIQTKYV